MADGSTKAIEAVEVGDRVLATDPETGEQGARTVAATINGEGSKTLVQVRVDATTEREAPIEGESAGAESASELPGPVVAGDVVTATEGHPFWVPELDAWVDAMDLAPGMWLQTSSGTWVQISAVEVDTQPSQVHNLTVQGVHTYHVMAGDLDLLNHNCNRVFSVNSSGYATALPVREIDSVAYPGGVQNFTNAIANGHSPIVARLTGRSVIRANRNAAQRGQPRPGALAQGLSWEEFPFASTYEVGAGATLRLISRRENVAQGRDSLWPFLRGNGIQGGGQYFVRVQ